MKKKLDLKVLSVKSFVTTKDDLNQATVKGGTFSGDPIPGYTQLPRFCPTEASNCNICPTRNILCTL